MNKSFRKKTICISVLCLCVVVAIAFAVLVSGKEEKVPSYTDVDESAWYYGDVMYCIEKSWIDGVDRTHFAAEEPITRADFLNALYRLAGMPSVNSKIFFTDVSEDAPYADAVRWAVQNGVANTGSTLFLPDEKLKREEMACIVYGYIQNIAPQIITAEPCIDKAYLDMNAVSETVFPAVDMMRSTGLFSNGADSAFRPQEAATRAEAAMVLRRMERRSRTE